MPEFNLGDMNNILLVLAVYGGMVAAAFWLAITLWAYRDMRARSRDRLAQLLVALMVAVLTIPGLVIYILLRPRETLSEAYERSLEEEALLQEIEEKPTCPGCGQRVSGEWQACPYCHTRLKKPCISCGKMLELSWNLCPHCATGQVNFRPDQSIGHVRPIAIGDQWVQPANRSAKGQQIQPVRKATEDSLNFVEGEEY